MTNLIIRAEKAEDFHNTELMAMRSFWNKYFPGCVEHNMLRVIRASADYLPEISRLAELDRKIVGVVESVDGEIFNVRYWELVIPCRLADGFDESIAGKPVAGSDVQFIWNHKGGDSKITKVIKNLLDDENRNN